MIGCVPKNGWNDIKQSNETKTTEKVDQPVGKTTRRSNRTARFNKK